MRNNIAVAVAVALSVAAPAAAQTVPQTTPVPIPPMYDGPVAAIMPALRLENLFVVINNTNRALLCTSRSPDGSWQRWFEVPSAANWQGTSISERIYFFCRPPVAQVPYKLKPGTRYSLIPDGGGVKLVEVVTGRVR